MGGVHEQPSGRRANNDPWCLSSWTLTAPILLKRGPHAIHM